MSPSPASDPGSSSIVELLTLLRDLARTERLEGYERAALRRAAAELERLQPGNLYTRSEYRAVVSRPGVPNIQFAGPVCPTKREATKWGRQANTSSSSYPNEIHHLEHRTVVESEWRPTHV